MLKAYIDLGNFQESLLNHVKEAFSLILGFYDATVSRNFVHDAQWLMVSCRRNTSTTSISQSLPVVIVSAIKHE